MNCAICTVLVTLMENYINFKKSDINSFVGKEFCSLFPTNLRKTCSAFIEIAGGNIIYAFTNKINSDTICEKSGFCADFP